MSKENSVLIIYTGGTIGMIKDEKTQSLTPVDFTNIYQTVPLLKEFEYRINSVSLKEPKDSSEITQEHWVEIAEIISENYNHYDGFVVLHGTDTMAYTASALSFILENLSKPVVITGSQLPIRMLRSDGRDNLITAIEIAASHKNGKPIVPEVSVFFEDKLYRGNRTTKMSAEYFDAFVSPNYPVLAKAGVSIHFNEKYILNRINTKSSINLCAKMSDNIALLKLFPGISENYVKAIFSILNLKAVVFETYGAGNSPSHKFLLDIIDKAIKNNIIVLNISQCLVGSVDMSYYETGRRLLNIGVLNGKDMTTEAALTKLMYLFGKYNDLDIVKTKILKSISGEIS